MENQTSNQEQIDLQRQMVAGLNRLIEIAETGNFSPVAYPVASATEVQQGEKKVRSRVVDAAKSPRDYINEYLDQHPDLIAMAGTPNGIQYRDLAQQISEYYGMDFDHTTVYRTIKKRK